VHRRQPVGAVQVVEVARYAVFGYFFVIVGIDDGSCYGIVLFELGFPALAVGEWYRFSKSMSGAMAQKNRANIAKTYGVKAAMLGKLYQDKIHFGITAHPFEALYAFLYTS
jgi:hypothetical protein